MPESFRLLGFTSQLWTPLVLTATDQTAAARKDRSLHLFARLKADATVERARAEFVTLARRAAENFPEAERGWGATVRTLPDFLVYDFEIRNALTIMMTTVAFVLMIACANVAGLLLARAAGRRKELAIRIALGAGRLRVILQLLTEGLLIALLGGAAGLLGHSICSCESDLQRGNQRCSVESRSERPAVRLRCLVDLRPAVWSGSGAERIANRCQHEPERRRSRVVAESFTQPSPDRDGHRPDRVGLVSLDRNRVAFPRNFPRRTSESRLSRRPSSYR